MAFDIGNFQSPPGFTKSIDAAALTANVLFRPEDFPFTTASLWLRVVHFGAGLVFVDNGDVDVVATLDGSIPVGPDEPFYMRAVWGNYLAAITLSPTTLYVTPGYL